MLELFNPSAPPRPMVKALLSDNGLAGDTSVSCRALVVAVFDQAQRFNLVATRFVAGVVASIVTTLLLALVSQTTVALVPPDGAAPPLQLVATCQKPLVG